MHLAAEMCLKEQNSDIRLQFLPLTRTFCGATKTPDMPSGGKSLTALRQYHASEHQTCLAGQACFAAEECQHHPTTPGGENVSFSPPFYFVLLRTKLRRICPLN